MQTDPVDAVLSRLSNVRRMGGGWMASSPTRKDSHPSLSIRRGDDGRCLLNDHGGSTAEEIVEALGLTMGDLFADDGPRGRKDWRDMVQAQKPRKVYAKPEPLPDPRMTKAGASFLEARKIPLTIIKRVGGFTETRKFGTKEVPCLCFPYTKDGEVVNVKYRSLVEKDFRMTLDAEQVFWNRDNITPGEDIYIVEGELDGCALMVAGYENVISPPGGAKSITEDVMESVADLLADDSVRVFLAGDMDTAGEEMMDGIAHRVGRERCFRVRWPEGCKDANDTLVQHGEEAIQEAITAAEPLEVDGIVSIESISPGLWKLYEGGQQPGLSTGWQSFDEFYTVFPGYWTVVTGRPGLGKTTFLNALATNMARLHGWTFGLCSLETRDTTRHAAMLASNYIGKPFREGFLERMSAEELVAAEIWLDAHFHFIQPAVPTIDSILAGAKALVYRTGAKGIVIDPWNRIRHPGSMNDGDSIARTIGQISEFAHRFRVHVWLVAHPTKLQQGADGKYPTATLNQIAGSYMFEAMADNGISLGEDGEFQILKTRPEEVGKKGTVHLGFHRPTGRFYDPNAPIGVVAGTESLAEWRPSTPRYIGEEGDGWKEEEPQGDIADIIMPFAAADGGD